MKKLDQAAAISRLIDERKYQDSVRITKYNEHVQDEYKSPEAFLIYIEKHLNDAKNAAYNVDTTELMTQIRKIGGLSLAAIEAFDCPKREL